jgi:TRAP-type C4-dicarboxylate transport system substrate-binding protein
MSMAKSLTSLSRTRRNLLGGIGASAFVAGIAAPKLLLAQKLSWIGASATPPTDFISQMLDFYAKRVGELTKGQITIATHHAGSLGGEREHIEGLLQGSVHVATPGQGLLAGWYRPAEVWTHPYLFKDVAHKDRVWDTMREEYQEDVAKTARLRPIAAIPRMPRQLTCNRVVKTPADMKGLKIRVPETALWKRTFELFGSSPTPLPFPEVFQALKSKLIDGQENPIALTFNSGIFDVNTHLSLTEHMMQDNCLLLADQAYQKVSPEPEEGAGPGCAGRRSRHAGQGRCRRPGHPGQGEGEEDRHQRSGQAGVRCERQGIGRRVPRRQEVGRADPHDRLRALPPALSRPKTLQVRTGPPDGRRLQAVLRVAHARRRESCWVC